MNRTKDVVLGSVVDRYTNRDGKEVWIIAWRDRVHRPAKNAPYDDFSIGCAVKLNPDGSVVRIG